MAPAIGPSHRLSFDGSRGVTPISAPRVSPSHGAAYGIVTPSPRGSTPHHGRTDDHFDISTPAAEYTSQVTAYFNMGTPDSRAAPPKAPQFFRDASGQSWINTGMPSSASAGKEPEVGKWVSVSHAGLQPGTRLTWYFPHLAPKRQGMSQVLWTSPALQQTIGIVRLHDHSPRLCQKWTPSCIIGMAW